MIKEAKKGAKLSFLIAMGFIWAGATGNLIDSMFYDFIFDFNPCDRFNQLEGSGVLTDCKDFGRSFPVEIRHKGFLLGNVVDMFQFDVMWPKWVPYFGGGQVFPAIWNVADGSITVGVAIIIIRQRHFFPKNNKEEIDVQAES
jgi:signal peptidase II